MDTTYNKWIISSYNTNEYLRLAPNTMESCQTIYFYVFITFSTFSWTIPLHPMMVNALNKEYALYKLNINKTTDSNMLSILGITADIKELKINSF